MVKASRQILNIILLIISNNFLLIICIIARICKYSFLNFYHTFGAWNRGQRVFALKLQYITVLYQKSATGMYERNSIIKCLFWIFSCGRIIIWNYAIVIFITKIQKFHLVIFRPRLVNKKDNEFIMM